MQMVQESQSDEMQSPMVMPPPFFNAP